MSEAPGYDPVAVQARWQARWAADRLDEVDTTAVERERKFYNLVEFPYPSAEGLHVGHAYTYCGADTHGRWLRMRGRTVFQPIGFDSFGIHTENYALRVGRHPRSEEHTSELQSRPHLVCRLLLEKKKHTAGHGLYRCTDVYPTTAT